MTSDEITKAALERLNSWNDKKAELLLVFTFDVPRNRAFQIVVTVFSIRDDHSSITLDWHRLAIDPSEDFLFSETQGRWDVFLEGAAFAVSDDPKPSVTISRGPFRCTLTELRASAFA